MASDDAGTQPDPTGLQHHYRRAGDFVFSCRLEAGYFRLAICSLPRTEVVTFAFTAAELEALTALLVGEVDG